MHFFYKISYQIAVILHYTVKFSREEGVRSIDSLTNERKETCGLKASINSDDK